MRRVRVRQVKRLGTELETAGGELVQARAALEGEAARQASSEHQLAEVRAELDAATQRAEEAHSLLVTKTEALDEASKREAGVAERVASLEAQLAEAMADVATHKAEQEAAAAQLASKVEVIERMTKREAELNGRIEELSSRLERAERDNEEKRDAIASLVLNEVTATRRGLASPGGTLPSSPQKASIFLEGKEERWLASSVRMEANKEKEELLERMGGLNERIITVEAEMRRLETQLEEARLREAVLKREASEALQAAAEAKSRIAAADAEAATAREGATQQVADMEKRMAVREQEVAAAAAEAAKAAAAAARKEANSEEGITQANRMSGEVRSIEARLAEAHGKFVEERLLASKLQFDWAVQKEAEERGRADAAIAAIEEEKAVCRAKQAEAEAEMELWKGKVEGAEEAASAARAERAAAVAKQAEAEVAAAEANERCAKAEATLGDAVLQRHAAEASTSVVVGSISEAEECVLEALARVHAAIADQLAAEERAAAADSERRRAVQEKEEAEAKANEAAEVVRVTLKQRDREVAKAAGNAKKEASKAATAKVAQEAERLNAHTKRQLEHETKRLHDEFEERERQREDQLLEMARGELDAAMAEMVAAKEAERVAAVAEAVAEAAAVEEALRAEWAAVLTRDECEAGLLRSEVTLLEADHERISAMIPQQALTPQAVMAMRRVQREVAQRELEEALRETQQHRLLGLSLPRGVLPFSPRDSGFERLAKAVAAAHAAGVPPERIASAEVALKGAFSKEEGKVAEQVSQLVVTLDKLQTAGTQARLAHKGLTRAGFLDKGGSMNDGDLTNHDPPPWPSLSALSNLAASAPVSARSVGQPIGSARRGDGLKATVIASPLGGVGSGVAHGGARRPSSSGHGDGSATPTSPVMRARPLQVQQTSAKSPKDPKFRSFGPTPSQRPKSASSPRVSLGGSKPTR